MTDHIETAAWSNEKLRLILTDECNIDCFYCHNEGQKKGHSYFSDNLLNRVMELIRTRPPHSVTLSGGETLLHPRLETIVSRIKPACPAITVVTNGLLLNRNIIDQLVRAGVTKIRLGADSLFQENSRPTLSKPCPTAHIRRVIDMLFDSPLNFELNIVLTKYNVAEIPELLRFCAANRLSAKVFEHLEVERFGAVGLPALMYPRPVISFDKFKTAVKGSGVEVQIREVPGLDGANFTLEGDGFVWRYCRYLCPFGLCHIKGTRIDPGGGVYLCMKKHVVETISELEPLGVSLAKIARVTKGGCCHQSA